MKPNWSEYGAEACGTGFNLLVGISAGVLNFSPDFPIAHLIPSPSLRLLLTGLIYAGSGSLFAITPLGKLSGAHINPSVSIAFLLGARCIYTIWQAIWRPNLPEPLWAPGCS
jgi:aquaporin Z